MAKNEGLLCLICGEVPCGCNKPQGAPPRKKAAPKKATPKPVEKVQAAPVESPVKPSFRERMRQAATEKQQEEVRRRAENRFKPMSEEVPASRFSHKMTDEEAALLAAVRTLSEAFEIHPDDLAPFKEKLDKPPSVEERAGTWRYRKNARGF